MAYELRPGRAVDDEVRRAGVEVCDDALASVDTDPAPGSPDWHEAVHDIRKRMKELRALTRLVRKAAPDVHDEDNTAARDLARRISDVRDAHAMLETLDLVADRHEDVATAARLAVREQRLAARDELVMATPPLSHLRDDLTALRERVQAWDVPDDGFDTFAGGLAKTYGRVVDRLDDATDDPTVEALHELRKRVKYHRLQVELLVPAWPDPIDAREEAVHDLTDVLGDDHDLAVLRRHLPDDPHGEAVAELLDADRAERLEPMLLAVRRAFAEDADAFVARYRDLWTTATELATT